MELIEGQFGAGGMVEHPTARSLRWEPMAGGDDSHFDFDIESVLQGKLPNKNQASSGSCTAQAVSYYAQVLQAYEMFCLTGLTFDELKENQSEAVPELSAKAVYSQTYLPGGGAYLSDAFSIALKWGMIAEKLVPSYPVSKSGSTYATEAHMRDLMWKDEVVSYMAERLKNKAFAFVPCTFDAVAAAIRQNLGVALVVGGVNNGSWMTPEPKPPKGSADWYHAVYCGKTVITKDRGIQTPNSWGLPFWQTLYEDYFASGHVVAALTLIDKPSANYVRLYRESREKPGVNLYRDLPANQSLQIQGFVNDGWSYFKLPNAIV